MQPVRDTGAMHISYTMLWSAQVSQTEVITTLVGLQLQVKFQIPPTHVYMHRFSNGIIVCGIIFGRPK